MDIFVASEDGAASPQMSGLVAGYWKQKLSTHGSLAE